MVEKSNKILRFTNWFQKTLEDKATILIEPLRVTLKGFIRYLEVLNLRDLIPFSLRGGGKPS